jgi:hypothetical protein
MSITIRVQDKTPELMQKMQAAIERFVADGADYIEGQLKAELDKAKSGKAYKRKSREHIASAPGESPATDSDNLKDSITIILENSLEAKIGTPVEYALLLEDGTPGGQMAPRPLWAATANSSLPTLENMLHNEIAHAR